MPRLACRSLVLSALLATALQAQPAFLVKDIASGFEPPTWPYDRRWVALGNLAVFAAYDTVHGIEIWKSDGTAAGTHPILDICPGICSADPGPLVAVGSTVFFGADDGVHGPSLWKTDGTAAGTTLVRETAPSAPAAVGGLLVFAAMTPESGYEIWRSDGTRAGTFPLGDLMPGPSSSFPRLLGYAGDWLLFSASDPVQRGLWRTDGTVANTSFVASAGAWYSEYTQHLYPSIGGRLFYSATDNHLWVSDGTPVGTYKVSNLFIGGISSGIVPPLAAAGNEVYFSSNDASGWELWKSDGTPAGTVLVKDLNPGAESSFPLELTTVGDLVFFRAISSASSAKLWRSDGTAAGTLPIEPGTELYFEDGFSGFQALGDKLLFFGFWDGYGREPGVSDGTSAGTDLLDDIYPGPSSSISDFLFPPNRLDAGAIADGEWLFRAKTPDGWGVWKSDGTAAGTELVEQIHEGAGASGLSPLFDPAAPSLADLDGTLIFAANDDGGPMELWRSDGSEAGTSQIDDQLTPSDLTRLGGHVYFSAYSLWRTDGATVEVGQSASGSNILQLTVAGPYLFYVRADLDGDRLERTDGTTSVQIINVGGTILRQLTAAGSKLFFSRLAGDGEELWQSSGAPFDAVELEIFPGEGSAQPRSIAAFGSSVFLSADDGSTGRELWFSDGTPAGTRRVKDIFPGPGSSGPHSTVAAGNLAFFVADDGIAGAELWRSNGTAAGTFRVKDIRTGPQSSLIRSLIAHGNRVFFAADDGVNGAELWTSDGTEAGTFLVEDIRPGAGSSYPGNFRAVGHAVLFAADDGTHGLEPWRTDGTAPGTFLIQDVLPGLEPSSPVGFTLSGDYLYFIANDRAHGFELWALDRAVLSLALSAAKRVVSPAFEGGTVTYEIVITNTGAGPHPDNPGDEMVDILPAPLDLTGASSDVGTVSLDFSMNKVAWNGALDPGESATVTIEATVASFSQYQSFSNQATLSFDSDGDGVNESAGVSDDPGRSGSGQATPVVVSTPPLDFHTVTPCRVLDTRSSTPLASGVARTITLSGTCGIPATAKAVAANLTVLGATAQGNLVVYPAGIPVPSTSNANFSAGQVRANNAHLALAGGQVDARALVVGGGTVHLILDVNGYYE